MNKVIWSAAFVALLVSACGKKEEAAAPAPAPAPVARTRTCTRRRKGAQYIQLA